MDIITNQQTNQQTNRQLNPRETIKRFQLEMRWNKLYARPGPLSYILVLDGLRPSFNIGKLIRSAQGFGVREIFLLNIPYFNPFPAKGASRYIPLRFFDNAVDGYQTLLEMGYEVYAFEADGAKTLGEFQFPEKTALVLGNEVKGISQSLDFKKNTFEEDRVHRVRIQTFGKLNSLNVSVAGSVAMYEYVRQHGVQFKTCSVEIAK